MGLSSVWTWVGRCAVGASCLLALIAVAGPQPEQLVGHVVEVDPAMRYPDGGLFQPTKVGIELESELLPRFGDPVRFQEEVPGVGVVDVEGAWIVEEVQSDRVIAVPEAASVYPRPSDYSEPIEPKAGQSVVISSVQPRTPEEVRLAGELFAAAAEGRTVAVRDALEGGIDPNVRGRTGVPSLGVATSGGHVGVVRLLLEFGADTAIHVRGHPLLSGVAGEDSTGACLSAVLEAGADPSVVGRYGITPLHAAAQGGPDLWLNVLQLVRAGADVNASMHRSVPPLIWRQNMFGDSPGEVVAKIDRTGATPLMIAALYDAEDTLRVLLASGADRSVTNGAGQSALELARTVSECDECVEVLTDPVPDKDSVAELLYDELEDAIERDGDVDRLRLLLELGANPGRLDRYGRTPLHWLADDPDEELPLGPAIDALLEAGAEVDVPEGEMGGSPLMVATAFGNIAVARAFLDRGADVNYRASGDEEGGGAEYTALMIAAQRGDAEFVRLLLESGADPEGRNAEGLTAADLATEAGYAEIAEMLRAATLSTRGAP